jgi:hypothetical protein
MMHRGACRDKDGMPEKELELREDGELLRALAASIALVTHAAVCVHHRNIALAATAQHLGHAFTQMGALEQAAMHVEVAEAASRFGEGCVALAVAEQATLGAAADHAQVWPTAMHEWQIAEFLDNLSRSVHKRSGGMWQHGVQGRTRS